MIDLSNPVERRTKVGTEAFVHVRLKPQSHDPVIFLVEAEKPVWLCPVGKAPRRGAGEGGAIRDSQEFKSQWESIPCCLKSNPNRKSLPHPSKQHSPKTLSQMPQNPMFHWNWAHVFEWMFLHLLFILFQTLKSQKL